MVNDAFLPRKCFISANLFMIAFQKLTRAKRWLQKRLKQWMLLAGFLWCELDHLQACVELHFIAFLFPSNVQSGQNENRFCHRNTSEPIYQRIFRCILFECTRFYRFAEHKSLTTICGRKKSIIIYVIRVRGMAENRAYCVIVAQFHCEIKSPFSVTLTVKSLHMVS